MKRLMCCVAWLGVWMAMVSAVDAQDRGGGHAPMIQSSATVSGASVVRTGRWAQLRSTIHNPSDEAQQLIVATSLGKQAQLQFGAQVWLPPHSRRTVEWPAHVDAQTSVAARRGLEMQTVLLLPSASGGERQWLSRHEGQAIIEPASMNMAILGATGVDASLHDMAARIRGATSGDERGARTLRPENAPILPQTWDTLDSLVLAGAPELEPQRLASLRQWVLAGGRLWVMLDQTDPQFMEQLLGDYWQITPIDRVPLHRVVFGPTRQAGDTYDEPVTLARTLAPPDQVMASVGQWPAAMKFTVGEGLVIVTTLSPRAWLTPQAKPIIDDLGNQFFRRSVRHDALMQASSTLAAQHIGRPIVAGWLVMTALVVMVALLVIIGLILHRRSRLEWMGLWGPAVAVVTAGVLLAIGQSSQGQVPLTISSASLVQVTPLLGQAVSRGSAAVYSPRTEPGPLAAMEGGSFLPDLSGLEGRVVRLLATDLDHWSWQNVEFSSGVIRTGWHERHFAMDEPVRVTGQFGPQGLVVQASLGALGMLQDTLIASPAGVMIATPHRDGQTPENAGQTAYLASPEGTLARGQYLRPSGSILTGTQQQRQAFYAQVFSERGGLPQTPSLAGWTHHLKAGLTLPDTFETQDSAAVMIPIDIQPTPAGQSVLIPSTFLPFTTDRRLPGEQGRTTIFDAQKRQWISNLTAPHRLVLAFPIPPQVLPLRIDQATLTLDLRAPQRTIEIFGADRPRDQPVATYQSPSGVTTLELDLRDRLVTQDDGWLMLVVSVGDAGATPWTMYDVDLQIQGQVQPGQDKP